MTPEEEKLISDWVRAHVGDGESYLELKAILPENVADGEAGAQVDYDLIVRSRSRGTLEADFRVDEMAQRPNDILTWVHTLSSLSTRAYADGYKGVMIRYARLVGPEKALAVPKSVAKRILPAFTSGYTTKLATLLFNDPERPAADPRDIQFAVGVMEGIEQDMAKDRLEREKQNLILNNSPQAAKSGCLGVLLVGAIVGSVLLTMLN